MKMAIVSDGSGSVGKSYFSRRDGGTSTRSAPGITGSRKGVP